MLVEIILSSGRRESDDTGAGVGRQDLYILAILVIRRYRASLAIPTPSARTTANRKPAGMRWRRASGTGCVRTFIEPRQTFAPPR